MPHLVIEYSSGLGAALDPQGLMQALCDAVAGSGLAGRGDLKARMLAYDNILLSDGSQGFIHLTLSLLAGRTPEQKEWLGMMCRDVLVAACPDADAISVDVRDMDPVAYKKRVRPAP